MSSTKGSPIQMFDDAGNLLPQLDPTSNMMQIIILLEYARFRGFRVGPTVQVGDTIVQVRDIRQQNQETSDQTKETDIWEEHGYTEKG